MIQLMLMHTKNFVKKIQILGNYQIMKIHKKKMKMKKKKKKKKMKIRQASRNKKYSKNENYLYLNFMTINCL